MRRILAITAIITATTAPIEGLACSIVLPADPHDPAAVREFEDRMQNSAIVVLARPMVIKRTPLAAAGKYLTLRDTYQQVVVWRVLYSWKGSEPGVGFQTIRKIEPETPCVGWDTISNYEPRLLYAFGKPPYSSYYSIQASGAERDLLYLQERYNPVSVPEP